MPLNGKFMCGCTPYVPRFIGDEESGLCEQCGLVYDERLYGMRLRQHWDGTENPIPEGADDLDVILKAIDPKYRAATST